MSDDGLVLDSEAWLDAVDNTNQGEVLPTVFGGNVPPFVRGRATILGAETEVGKTALGLQAWHEILDKGYSAAYVTLEMTPADLFERFWQRFGSREDCRDWLQGVDAYVSQPYVDAHEIEEIILRKYDFVVVDHLHEIPFDGHEDLGRKVRRLAALAPATNTALLMLSQMKQRDPVFASGPPTKRDFSWTKAISEVAAVLMALWRPDEDAPNDVELVTLKNRFGPKPPPLPLSLNPQTVSLEVQQYGFRY